MRSGQQLRGDGLYSYYWGAENLLTGHPFVSFGSTLLPHTLPDAKHPPGFVTMLGILYKLGFHSPTSLMYWNCVLGASIIVLIGILLAKLVSERAGIVGALICAVYPNIWINDTLLMSETLMMFGYTLGLLGVYAFHRRPTWQRVVVASAGFTIATSARAETIVLFGIVILPLVLARRSLPLRRRMALLGVAAILPLVVFVPWTVYNQSRFAEPVYLSTGFGSTMAATTCGSAFYGPNTGYSSSACLRRYAPPQPKNGKPLDQSEVGAYMQRRALRYISDHRRRFPKVVVAREARILGVWNPSQQDVMDSYIQQRGSVRLTRVARWAFWVLALLSIAGAIVWRRRHIPLYPLVAEIGLTAVVIALTFGNTRYRCGVEICLVLLAATAIDVGICGIGRSIERSRGGRQTALGSDDQVPSVPAVEQS